MKNTQMTLFLFLFLDRKIHLYFQILTLGLPPNFFFFFFNKFAHIPQYRTAEGINFVYCQRRPLSRLFFFFFLFLFYFFFLYSFSLFIFATSLSLVIPKPGLLLLTFFLLSFAFFLLCRSYFISFLFSHIINIVLWILQLNISTI